MMTTTATQYLTHTTDWKHTCDISGFGRETQHAGFTVAFLCDGCGELFEADLCAAWPCVERDCPTCFTRVSCDMPSDKTTARLR